PGGGGGGPARGDGISARLRPDPVVAGLGRPLRGCAARRHVGDDPVVRRAGGGGVMIDSPTLPAEPAPTPWPRLLGALGASLDARSLVLAAAGVLLLWGGWAAIDAVAPPGTGS